MDEKAVIDRALSINTVSDLVTGDEYQEIVEDLLICIPELFDYHETVLLRQPIIKNGQFDNVKSFEFVDKDLQIIYRTHESKLIRYLKDLMSQKKFCKKSIFDSMCSMASLYVELIMGHIICVPEFNIYFSNEAITAKYGCDFNELKVIYSGLDDVFDPQYWFTFCFHNYSMIKNQSFDTLDVIEFIEQYCTFTQKMVDARKASFDHDYGGPNKNKATQKSYEASTNHLLSILQNWLQAVKNLFNDRNKLNINKFPSAPEIEAPQDKLKKRNEYIKELHIESESRPGSTTKSNEPSKEFIDFLKRNFLKRWQNMKLILEEDDENVMIVINDNDETFHYSNMGFAKGIRNSIKPKRSWEFFIKFANQPLGLTKCSPALKQFKNIPTEASNLRKHLKSIFLIDDDPFFEDLFKNESKGDHNDQPIKIFKPKFNFRKRGLKNM